MSSRRRTKRTGPASCQACRARIVFVRMEHTGKALPVDPIPDPLGNVCARTVTDSGHLLGWVISAEHPAWPQYTRYMSHHATCGSRPKAAPKPTPEPEPTLFDTEGLQ